MGGAAVAERLERMTRDLIIYNLSRAYRVRILAHSRILGVSRELVSRPGCNPVKIIQNSRRRRTPYRPLPAHTADRIKKKECVTNWVTLGNSSGSRRRLRVRGVTGGES